MIKQNAEEELLELINALPEGKILKILLKK